MLLRMLLALTWELPQTILGLFVAVIGHDWPNPYRTVRQFRASWVFSVRGAWGVSLGPFICLGSWQSKFILKHEYGHSIQSMILGPLYLLVVGLPSILRASLWLLQRRDPHDYYQGYPEKWASKLGGAR